MPPTSAADEHRAERGDERQRQRDARAEQQPAEHVAAVAVGAEQQQRRAPRQTIDRTRWPPRNQASGTGADRSCS